MVRQDHLESLADPELTEAEIHEARGVVNFIRVFLEEIRPNLIHQNESLKNAAAGLPPSNQVPGNQYVELTGDDDDLPEGLTQPN